MRTASMLALLLTASALPATAASPAPQFGHRPPRLVVFLVVDQLRADYLSRFRDRLRPDGIRRLMQSGAWFPYGEYDVAQAMTGPGHATIATGAWPARHGIPVNNWADRSTGEKVYCAEDPAFEVLDAAEPDAHDGTSPGKLLGPTIGDALKGSGAPARVVTLALKDRVAILMGGRRADAAVWFDARALQWRTSSFYAPDGATPAWIKRQNDALARRRGETYTWTVSGAGNGLSEDGPAGGFNASWKLGEDPEAVESPLGSDLLVEMARAAIDAHALGQDETPDILAVGFSNFDMVGHEYGPNHRRTEEILVAVDAAIARLLKRIESAVPGGLEEVLFVFTGDHGAPPTADYSTAHRVPAGRMDEKAVRKALEAHLRKAFGAPRSGDWVRDFRELNLFLAPDGADLRRVRAEAARWLGEHPSVLYAIPSDVIERTPDRLPPDPYRRRILNQYVPGRSGDVLVLVRPFHMLTKDPSSHLTGFTYDRLVPIILSGRGIEPGVYASRAQAVDIAPTLAFLLGVVPPALSEGRVLAEALMPAR